MGVAQRRNKLHHGDVANNFSRLTPRWVVAAVTVLGIAACSAPTPQTPEPTESPIAEESETPTDPSTPTTTEPPEVFLPWGPSQTEVEQAIDDAGELTDEELAGLVIVARYDGADPQVPATLVADGFGGVILFGPNVDGLKSVRAAGEQVQKAAKENGWDWPAIMAVDNEGGKVQRLSGASGPWTTYPPFAELGSQGSKPTREAMTEMGWELRASTINTNYAPVGDLASPGQGPIGDRSPSADPQEAADIVSSAITGFTDAGILSAIKHFPGHGAVTADSHEELPTLDGSVSDLEKSDLIPFASAIEAGVPMVMVGHIAVPEWEEGTPASLVPEAYDYVRDDLQFTGVTITDGLDMGALEGDSAYIARTALMAGADILLTPADPYGAREGIVEGIDEGTVSRARLEEAAGHMIAMMRYQRNLADEVGQPPSDLLG